MTPYSLICMRLISSPLQDQLCPLRTTAKGEGHPPRPLPLNPCSLRASSQLTASDETSGSLVLLPLNKVHVLKDNTQCSLSSLCYFIHRHLNNV